MHLLVTELFLAGLSLSGKRSVRVYSSNYHDNQYLRYALAEWKKKKRGWGKQANVKVIERMKRNRMSSIIIVQL